jgi:4-amino-4-deoxy-L-arabinose transferase-like glycosyltransferase
VDGLPCFSYDPRVRIPHIIVGALLLLASSSGQALTVRGDVSWVATPSCPTGWMQVDFDDSSWSPVEHPWMHIAPKRWSADAQARPFWDLSGGHDVCVRRTFRLQRVPPGGTQAHVWVDDDYQFYLNGVLVADNNDSEAPLPGETYQVGSLLRSGDNAIAIRLRNRGAVMGALFSLHVPGVPEQPRTWNAAAHRAVPWLLFAAVICCVALLAVTVRTYRETWARPFASLPPGALALMVIAMAAACQYLMQAGEFWSGSWDQPLATWDWPALVPVGALLLGLVILRAAGSVSDNGTPRWEGVVLGLILLLAAVLRAYRVDEVPVGFYQDEATNGNDALALLDLGGVQIWSESVGGRPTLFLYLLLACLNAFGVSYAALKVAPVAIGVATVAVVYVFGRIAFGARTALWAAFFLAVCRWHIHYSRMAWEAICLPLFLTAGLALLLFGLRQDRPRRTVDTLLLAGVVLGAGLYTYAAYRAVPWIVVVFLAATLFSADRALLRQRATAIGLFGGALLAGVVALPLLSFAWREPALYWARYSEVSLLNFMSYYGTPFPWLHQIGKSLLSFNSHGDELIRHNLPFAPHLDPVTGVLFLIGLATPATRVPHAGLRMLWTWFLTFLVLASLTTEGPHATRLLGLAPVAALFAGFGIVQLTEGRIGRGLGRARRGIVALVAAGCLGLNAHAYFILEAHHPDADFAYDLTGRLLCERLRTQHRVDVYWTDDLAFWADGQCHFLARDRYTARDLLPEHLVEGVPSPLPGRSTLVVLGREYVDLHPERIPCDEEGRPRLPFPAEPVTERDRQGEMLYYLYSF